jgi:hypothetical protein
MHQSPEKKLAKRRDKYVDFDVTHADANRRLYRSSQPNARKFARREDSDREPRQDRVREK